MLLICIYNKRGLTMSSIGPDGFLDGKLDGRNGTTVSDVVGHNHLFWFSLTDVLKIWSQVSFFPLDMFTPSPNWCLVKAPPGP